MWYFFILASLNLFDGVATYWGLSNGWIGEANPVMEWFWNLSPIYFTGFKLLLSIGLITVGLHFERFSFKRQWTFALQTVNVVYGFVFLLHLYWVTLLLI